MSVKDLFVLASALGSSYDNCDYDNLNEEEKFFVDYFNECLNDDNQEFKDACFETMILLLELATRVAMEEDVTQEEVQRRKDAIQQSFNQDDKERLDSFTYACIQTMGIYSDDRVVERKLRNERMN